MYSRRCKTIKFTFRYRNIILNFQISIMDGMPQFACGTCLETVKHFRDFREKSIVSEATLREIICHVSIKNTKKQSLLLFHNNLEDR